MQEIKKILVVSRMTRYCEETIKYGISLSWRYNSELSIVHISHSPHELDEWQAKSGCSEEEFANAFMNASVSLGCIIRDVRIGGQKVKELNVEGDPVEEILRIIEEEKIDLLVLLPAGVSPLEQVLFNCINEELVRRKPCQITFVPKVTI